MRKQMLLIISLLCFCLISIAQITSELGDSIKIIRLSHQKKRSKPGIIKIAPLSFITGSFPILYEQCLNDYLAIELGGGPTNRNYIRSLLRGGSNLSYNFSTTQGDVIRFEDLADRIYKFDNRRANFGYTFSIQPKLYYEGDALDGYYTGLQCKYSLFNFEIPALKRSNTAYSGYTHSGDGVKEYENVVDFMVFFGKQIADDRFTLDIGSAIGVRKVSGVKYVGVLQDNGVFVDGLGSYKQNLLSLGLMLTVGYQFRH